VGRPASRRPGACGVALAVPFMGVHPLGSIQSWSRAATMHSTLHSGIQVMSFFRGHGNGICAVKFGKNRHWCCKILHELKLPLS